MGAEVFKIQIPLEEILSQESSKWAPSKAGGLRGQLPDKIKGDPKNN